MTEIPDQVRALADGMREAASSYRAGALPLDRLVWELKSRISTMQGVADPEWVEQLRSAWLALEYVNAFWIEGGRTELTAEEKQQVEEGLNELLPMLVEY